MVVRQLLTPARNQIHNMKSKQNTTTGPVLNSSKNINRDTAQVRSSRAMAVSQSEADWCIARLKELIKEEKARRALAAQQAGMATPTEAVAA